MTKKPNLKNSRWRTTAILKMVLSLSQLQSFDFYEIWGADADLYIKNGHMTRRTILQIQNSVRPPS